MAKFKMKIGGGHKGEKSGKQINYVVGEVIDVDPGDMTNLPKEDYSPFAEPKPERKPEREPRRDEDK